MSGLHEEPTYHRHHRHHDPQTTGQRDLDTPHRHHGSHRRPHGSEKVARTDDPVDREPRRPPHKERDDVENKESTHHRHHRYHDPHGTGPRDSDNEKPPHRHHGSHRRPHDSDKVLKTNGKLGEDPRQDVDNEKPHHRHHGSHRRPHGSDKVPKTDDDVDIEPHRPHHKERDIDEEGLQDCVDGVEGIKLDSRHYDARGGGEGKHVNGSGGEKKDRHLRYADEERRHGHKSHRHEGHRHERHHDKHHCNKEHGHRHRHSGHRHEKQEKAEAQKKLYEFALLPFSENSGSSYPCKQSEIDFHRNDRFEKKNKGPFVSAMQATEEVMRWNDEKRVPAQEELDIIRRLTTAVQNTDRNSLFSPDLAVKTFADLDRVFFGGRLRGHVIVHWVEKVVLQSREKYGSASPTAFGQCRIRLSAERTFVHNATKPGRNPVALMFSTLLHEMCHAYEAVRSPAEWGRDQFHGNMFCTRIGKCSSPPLPPPKSI